MEILLVTAIVGGALFLAGRGLYRTLSGRAGCGCGTAACPLLQNPIPSRESKLIRGLKPKV